MKYKLVVFDLDGTIIDKVDYVWKMIHENLGIEDHPQRIKNRNEFLSGKITYYEWAKYDLDLMARHGADKETIMKVFDKAKVMEGALETLEALKSKGYKIAIISGSMNILLEKLIPDYREIFDHIFINRIIFNEEGEIEDVEVTPFDMEHKKTGLLELCELEGIDPKETVFVGDHDNDLDIAKAAGFSIAFNSKSRRLNEIADVVIEKKDLREILKYLN